MMPARQPDWRDRERFVAAIATGEIPFPADGDLNLREAVQNRRRDSLIKLIARQIAASMEREWSIQEKKVCLS